MTSPLPPGTILQHMYFKERLRHLKPGSFIEIGTGHGILSRVLLQQGWQGVGYDLNERSLTIASQVNQPYIERGHYNVRCSDWLSSRPSQTVDMVISCMVIEHFNEADEKRYFDQCRNYLNPQGTAILFVPSSPKAWGIEDEIAGHYRRYTFERLYSRLDELGWKIEHMAGLTYPLSNLLLPVSNFLVNRAEARKKSLDMQSRTVASGDRDVQFKTTFPSVLNLILNEYTLTPFHMLQKLNRRHPDSLVTYVEAKAS